jgi:hypothetical protein
MAKTKWNGKPKAKAVSRQLLEFRLEFGSYRGKLLPQVPAEYLVWAISNATKIPATDHWAIKAFVEAMLITHPQMKALRKDAGKRLPAEHSPSKGNGSGAADLAS